jgi:hypothetical protein
MKTKCLIAIVVMAWSDLFGCGANQPAAGEPAAPSQTEAGTEAPAPEGEVLLERDYLIMELTGSQEVEVGRRRLTVTLEGDRLIFEESVALEFQGELATWSATVVYGASPPHDPLEAGVETKLRETTVMTGSILFKGKVAHVSAKAFRGGIDEPDKPPEEHHGSEPLEGAILFTTALEVIAPKVLESEGTLEGVVLAEFPDDIDGPVNFKKNYVLAREPAGPDGSFVMKVLDGTGAEVTYAMEFDASGFLRSGFIGGGIHIVPVDSD